MGLQVEQLQAVIKASLKLDLEPQNVNMRTLSLAA